VTERINIILLEKVRCILSNAGLSKFFWTEALVYTCHIVNMLPLFMIGGKTPLEVWSEKVAQDYDSLRVFGCLTYYHAEKDKLGPRARKGVFVGFKKGLKGYKFWDPKDKKFILSRGVTCDETSILKPTDSQHVESEKTNTISQQVERCYSTTSR